jgi:hypothetical protein
VQHGGQERVVDRCAAQAREELVGPVAQLGGTLGRGQRVGAVDDLIRVSGESVQRVTCRRFQAGSSRVAR